MFVACDESGTNKRFFVVGSAWMPNNEVPEFEKKITTLRLKHKCWGEIKWSKLKDSTQENILCFYEEVIEMVVATPTIQFRFIVIDTRLLKEGRVDDKLQLKFLYLLISRNAKRLTNLPKGLHILFDKYEESRQSREEGWRGEARKYIEHHLGEKIEHFQPCDSHICSLIQVIDVLTGRVSEWKNVGGSEDGSRRRILKSLKKLKIGERYEVWNWIPAPKKQTSF